MNVEPPILIAFDPPAGVVAWCEPRAPLPNLRDGVHLWRISLLCDEDFLGDLRSALSGDELCRADAFHSEVHRRRFVVGRARLRAVLAQYVSTTAAAIRFNYGPWGKPGLADGGGGLEFNFSHSEDVSLLAVRRGGTVGVDVEHLNRSIDHLAVADSHFSDEEGLRVRQASPADRAAEFFRIWTRREAALKATGLGLDGITNGSTPEACGHRCIIRDLIPAEGFVAALALPIP